jgi:Protein of unknown function (DUF2806)
MSDSPGPLINIGDLAQPVTTLIEKVSAAVGVLYEPTRIIKKAEAEAEADRIKAISRLEISDLEKRTLNRILTEGVKEQERMENVLRLALPDVQQDAKPQELNDDWIRAFFGHVRQVSDEEMQSLWARVLAGETNTPRSYSRRTLALLSNLEKHEAELFTQLCTFTVHGSVQRLPLVFDYVHQMYASRAITFRSLSHLDSIGLIRFHSASDLTVAQAQRGETMKINYFDEEFRFYLDPAPAHRGTRIPMGKVEFTDSGAQLSMIAGAERENGFIPFLAEKWMHAGVRWCSPLGHIITVRAPIAR